MYNESVYTWVKDIPLEDFLTGLSRREVERRMAVGSIREAAEKHE